MLWSVQMKIQTKLSLWVLMGLGVMLLVFIQSSRLC